MIDILKISSTYNIRRMDDTDIEAILSLCLGNTQYYEYCQAKPSMEQILNDLHVTPPGKEISDKYYIGFYLGDTLVAVMDLIDGYPEPEIAFIGFFMMNKDLQGQGIGTGIIRETAEYLSSTGKTSIRLGIDKDNPQSTHFWKKNGFKVISEVGRDGWTVLVAEKDLRKEQITAETKK